MKEINVCVDILLPILCALISGGLTLFGVILTLKHGNKKDEETIKIFYKPRFYRIDPNQISNIKNDHYFCYSFLPEKKGTSIRGYFKNTDHSTFVLDKIIIGRKECVSNYEYLVDKNTVFYLHICFNDYLKENDEVFLFVKDIFGNEYKYKIDFEFPGSKDSAEIKNITEEI